MSKFSMGLLLTGLCLSTTLSVVQAELASSEWQRPVCPPAKNMCSATDMRQAVKITKSPAFQKDFNGVVERAKTYLDQLQPSPDKVVIADLDETLMDNVPYYAHHSHFDSTAWERWLQTSHDENSSVLHLLEDAKKRGFSVMYITGRSAGEVGATTLQVANLSWDGIYHRPQGISLTAQNYKSHVRQMLRELGYTIVLNIGDQVSDHDLPVDEAKGEFLLPNVMYTIY